MKEFELFVAMRYLRAKRKQAVISVITVLSVLGVAAGVMALVIALAINNGFRGTLQRNLLGATAHVSILEKEPGSGIENWRELKSRLSQLPGVQNVSPSLYGEVFIAGPVRASFGIVKGIDPSAAPQQAEMLTRLKAGSLENLSSSRGFPGIIVGSRMAQNAGLMMNTVFRVTNPQGELTPFGRKLTEHQFRVVGIFESGFYELDATWAFTTLESARMLYSVPDVVNSIELKLEDLDKAPETARTVEKIVGPKLAAIDWMERNQPILGALRMERVVTMITIGLIQLVGALNILVALVMIVMEKYKDIAILMSMGARHQQIRRVFMLQGVLIGVAGATLGLVLGYGISYLADRYRWLRLDEQVYSLPYVPFEPRPMDALWIAGIAIFISFAATLYPARNATRIAPVEALRYE
ncbi:MAG TPA: FtsX-like permease family protein [Bryobacteraceae bacterium]|nr:FtsX-like permease family protein [Bryobacteraceae bacterium]